MADQLKLGTRGPDVARLHQHLRAHGLEVPDAETAADTFGTATRDAVLAFQARSALPVTGEVDRDTLALLRGDPAGARSGLSTGGGPLASPTDRDLMSRAATGERGVRGRIVLEQGQPAAKVKLRVYQRGFGGSETLLKETETDEQGFYDTTYAITAGLANIEVRAVSGTEEIPLSKPKLADSQVVLNLAAPASLQPLEPEFARLSADVTRELGSLERLATAREAEGRQDLTLLNRSTGWDARVLALAARAAALGDDADVGLSPGVLYGLFRAGLPSEKSLLARVDPDAVQRALARVRDAGIVQLTDADIAEAARQFGQFARTSRLAAKAPGASSSYGDLLEAAPLEDAASRDRFASAFLKHRDTPAALWDDARAAGLAEDQIERLQVQGKLAYLTGNSHVLTERLQKGLDIRQPSQLADRDLFEAERWKAEIRSAAAGGDFATIIPPTYGGDTVDARLDAYAEDMARKVRRSYPTQVVARMIERDATDAMQLGAARQHTAQVMRKSASQGFKLGETPVETFLAQHTGVVAGLSAQDTAVVTKQLKDLQRVYQVSSSDEEMAILLGAGLRSAYDITAMSEARFIEYYGRRFPSVAKARMVHHRATQITSLTYNLFTIARRMETEQPVFGFSAPAQVQQAVRDELIKHYPTLEALFGSTDYCECEHCRSVLSPAAYLVDLLQQFVDVEPEVWSGFLAAWNASHAEPYTPRYKDPYSALIERRPDLPAIRLTCENTHTAMPYIDVVNEILEYSVAHGALAADAARDTGDATSAELLAEPQYVTRQAYDKLRDSRYPLTLPFDLWTETVRRFCAYFDAPLATLLEVFRGVDELVVPGARYDRAAVFHESLGFSAAELAVYTDPDPLARWFDLYGFSTAAEATTVATDADTRQRIDLNSAKALARRLDVTYKELSEIIQTGFVNPRLARLVVLSKIGVSIHSVKLAQAPANVTLYGANQDLLDKERSTLSAPDQTRYDALTQADWDTLKELQAFDRRLEEFAARFAMTRAALDAQLAGIPFDEILVLADPSAGCDFDQTTVQYASGRAADGIAFLKINVFVRLWRKLGWSIDEVDRSLQAFIPAAAPFEAATLARRPLQTAFVYLAHLNELATRLAVGKHARLKLLTLWAEVPTTGRQPLYAQLFLAPGVLRSDDVFDHPLGHYLAPEWTQALAESRSHVVSRSGVPAAQRIPDGPFAGQARLKLEYDALQETQHLAYQGLLTDADKAALAALSPSALLSGLLDEVQARGSDFRLIKGHLLALEGALGLTADDVRRVLEGARLSLDDAPLSVANVSLLYRHVLLARALKLPVRDLITLRQLSGIDPFTPIAADPITAIADDAPFTHTLRFVEVARQLREAGLTVEDLDYLLRHAFDPIGKYRDDPARTLAFAKTIADGVRAIRAEHAIPADPAAMDDDTLRQKLGLVLSAPVVERLLSMTSGTVQYTATTGGVAEADQLRPAAFEGEPRITGLRYDAVTQTQSLTYRGVLLGADKATLVSTLPKVDPPAPHVPCAVLGALLDDVQAQARAFFDKHLLQSAANAQPSTGFLQSSDFAPLFTPPASADPAAAQQDHLRDQRRRLVEGFLPFLQARLVRDLIVRTIAAVTGGDPALVEGLVTDTRLLGAQAGSDVEPLLNVFAALGGQGVQTTFHAAADASDDPLGTAVLPDADTELTNADGTPHKPAGTNSVRFEGYLEVPVPGTYRLFVAVAKANTRAEVRFEHLPGGAFWTGTAPADGSVLGDQPGQYLELKAGVPYRFTIVLRDLNGGGARVLVQGQTLPRDPLGQLVLYPRDGVDRADRTLVLVGKALQLVRTLDLTERELRYILAHAADFGDVDLETLPTRADEASLPAARESFAQLLRLAGYARLKRGLASGTDDLIGVFEANAAGDLDAVSRVIGRLARRDPATVKATAKALWAAPAFASERPVERLWEALKVVERFGVPPGSLLEWTGVVSPAATAERRFEIARDVKESIKARFDAETWLRVAQPIFDALRARQRDALVAYTLHQKGLARIGQLYEYFLLDPGMEPVVQTSRIRLAIASVQLFVQRCLLNLERDVHPSAIVNASYWEWMKRYRVWEANRKIFLFPENWLEPEFRDDKTHLFTELESALLEGDVSSDLVEDAFLAYLRKLEVLARLDILAMHVEDHANPAERTLHVFGRTHKEPFEYYYRRYANQAWTPWEPVAADIQGHHLAPVVWRDRLYLFWVTFIEQPDGTATTSDPAPNKSVSELKLSEIASAVTGLTARRTIEAHLHWSEYVKGEWNTPESGGPSAPIVKLVQAPFHPAQVFVHVSKETPDEGEERGVFIHLGGSFSASFFLAGRNSKPVAGPYLPAPAMPFVGSVARPTEYAVSSGAFSVSYNERISAEPGVSSGKVTAPIFQESRAHSILPCNNDLTPMVASSEASAGAANPAAVAAAVQSGLGEIASLMKPVFYKDAVNTLFVEPSVRERTLEEWQEWVTPAPQPDPGWRDPKWFDDLRIFPEIPFKIPRPMPGDPPAIDVDSLIPIKRRDDWLVNPATALVFDGALIGQAGRTPVTMLPAAALSEALDAGALPVAVHAGSDVGPALVAVTPGHAVALTSGGAALNVVGAAGFTAPLNVNLLASPLNVAGLAGRIGMGRVER